ncbi:MAG TPA: tyrosine-type recombinase/integrase [Thermoanaerobaculia bacterium]|nr:tyrosine-type recombinase/integrase [Thermoanaerobaculia bacterium]
MGQDGAIARYLGSARIRRFTRSTIERKRNEIARFRWWLIDEELVISLAAITDEIAREYRRHLADQAVSATTWAPQLYTLKHFFAWLHRNDEVLLDPFERVEIPRRAKTLPPYLTQSEVKAILDATPADAMLLDRAILEVLYSSALRIGELAQLNVSDVDLAEGIVFIRQGKGRKDRVVPLGRIAATLTRRYIGQLRIAAPSQRDALFVSDSGRRFTSDQLRKHVIVPALQRAGIDKHVTPHVLRHSCAIHLLENGADVRYVQALLGHAKLETTQKYTNVVPVELKKVHAASHPSEHQTMPAKTTPTRVAPSKWDALRRRRRQTAE